MATRLVPQRLSWALQTMAIAPSDHVLEIGCGRGVAASLVCQRLSHGRLVALDRSAAMAKAAEQRNIDSVEAGRAVFHATSLQAADLDGELFDKAFAVNVNLFWVRSSATEVERIRRVLKPDGAMYLFYEPPYASRAEATAARVATFLTGQGFGTTSLAATTGPDRVVVCVVARPERLTRSRRSGTGRTRA